MTRLPKERVRILSSGRIPIYTPQYGRVTGAEASARLWEAHAALKIDKNTFGNYPRHVCYQWSFPCKTCTWRKQHRELISRQLSLIQADELEIEQGWC